MEITNCNPKYPHLKKTFHAKWNLNGWCDHVIQPARDAVLEYYKVCTYNLLLYVKLIQWNYIPSATHIHRTSKCICQSITCASLFLNICTPVDLALLLRTKKIESGRTCIGQSHCKILTLLSLSPLMSPETPQQTLNIGYLTIDSRARLI